jgi:hypothetical protein
VRIKIHNIHLRVKGLSKQIVSNGLQDFRGALINYCKQYLPSGNRREAQTGKKEIDLGTITVNNAGAGNTWHDITARHIIRRALTGE